jgi:SAM-dependent methyltransferase
MIVPDTDEDTPGIAEDWYARAFGPLYPVLYAHRSIEAAAPEAAFALEQLSLSSTDRVLDLCCGAGRHMVHLKQRTPCLTGVDYSPQLLDLARNQLGPRARLVRADMRALPFAGTFDALTNFFTSFGYFDDAGNAQAVRCMAHTLHPGGRFFMDYLNAPHAEKALQPRTERAVENRRIVETRWLGGNPRRINKRTEVIENGAMVHRGEESVRLYLPEEIMTLLRQYGLEINRTFGDYDGQPLNPDQPRMIMVGHRT